ncbi:hypothetical protein SCUP234_11326 [Seiridium cupressi]
MDAKSNTALDGMGSMSLSDLFATDTVTVTFSSASSISSVSSVSKMRQNLAHVQSRSDVKIIDYLLVLDLPRNSRLQETISDLITRVCEGGRRHVNQTVYQSIQDSLIDVSIEAKTEFLAVDPLLQFGLWTAAWYKRMRSLRRELFATKVAGIHDERLLSQLRAQEQKKRLITVPLIPVVGHQWDMYLAYFDTASIILYGPVKMGCTETILDVYVLVASLKALGEWAGIAFKAAMEDWFMCGAGEAGDGCAGPPR